MYWTLLVQKARIPVQTRNERAYLVLFLFLDWWSENTGPMSSFSAGKRGHKMLCYLSNPVAFDQFAFISQPFRILLWFSSVLFPGFMIVLGREEERDTSINHLV